MLKNDDADDTQKAYVKDVLQKWLLFKVRKLVSNQGANSISNSDVENEERTSEEQKQLRVEVEQTQETKHIQE